MNDTTGGGGPLDGTGVGDGPLDGTGVGDGPGGDGRRARVVPVIGAGTIGLGWITLFLAHGHRVRVNSTRPEVGPAVHEALALFAPGLPGPPVDPVELARRLEIEPDLERAVDGADVVQEPIEQDYGVRDCAFRDPAGNLIRIQQAR